jgi:hypothetical protein
MDASAKVFVAVDLVLADVSPTLVDDPFEPQPARVVASAIVTIQLAVHRSFRTTGTLRDEPGPGYRFAKGGPASDRGVSPRANPL